MTVNLAGCAPDIIIAANIADVRITRLPAAFKMEYGTLRGSGFTPVTKDILSFDENPELLTLINPDGSWNVEEIFALADVYPIPDKTELSLRIGARVRIQNAPGYPDLFDQEAAHLIGREGKVVGYAPERGDQHRGCVWQVNLDGYKRLFFFKERELEVIPSQAQNQTEVPNRPFENWQATGNPDPSTSADF